MKNIRYTFTKPERLTNKILIDKLFTEGNSFVVYPFRIVWRKSELKTDFPAQVVISVSKRNFKQAVKRNLLKRRIREIYRTHKHIFYNELKQRNVQIAFMVVYMPRVILSSSEMMPGLGAALMQILEEYERSANG